MIPREKCCCFTGHRPEKLPWREKEDDPRCRLFKHQLLEEMELAYELGYRHFISGMARGTDLYFCETALSLRERHPDISVEAAIPYPGQSDRWSRTDQFRYALLLEQCNYETVVSHHYSPGCLQRRNRYMVDHASLLSLPLIMGKQAAPYTP